MLATRFSPSCRCFLAGLFALTAHSASAAHHYDVHAAVYRQATAMPEPRRFVMLYTSRSKYRRGDRTGI
jgi:hypothetical protein